MIEIKANSLKQIPLGRMGENLARKIVFDISAWIDIYGDGHAVLIHQRPQDAIPFPIAIEQHETEVWWPVTRTDTASSIGIGQCELQYYVGDTLVKSKSFETFVEDAMDEPSEEEPPAPEQGWVAQIVAIGLEAKISADAANTDAKIVKVLKEEVAQNASQVAQNTSDTANAKEAAETAKRLAEDAQLAAETAQKAAEDVQSAVAKFATDADGAKQGAETALKFAQDAAATAVQSLADIRTLHDQMQTLADGAVQDVADEGTIQVQAVQNAGEECVNSIETIYSSKLNAINNVGDTQTQRVIDEGNTQTANAKAQAIAAAQSASGAAQSAQEAAGSASEASTSETNAKASETAAKASEKAAADSASAAQQSATSAAESAAVYDDVVADVNQIKQEIADLPQPDWNQNDDTQPDYVKNRPFYTGDPVETVLVEESTVMFEDMDGLYGARFLSTFEATVGETYKVSWDGTVYECICVDLEEIPVLGNLSVMGAGSDTGEPFVMGVFNGEGIQIMTADSSSSHTFSISGVVEPVVKIDPKYLPASSKPAGTSYLTFSSPSSFTLKYYFHTKTWDGTLEYFASDKTWTVWDGTTILSAVAEDGEYVLYLRGTRNTNITLNDARCRLVLTGTDIKCIGNIENLLDYATVASGEHPAMANNCYAYMFSGCTSLTQAPVLPATTLADSCYDTMFSGCTSLTQAPALPATTLAAGCYQDMFRGCTALTQAPALPATTLATSCYQGMFASCTTLTQAPALPATTLAIGCYQNMFRGCTGITKAPALPATTLTASCYRSMFDGCTSLTQAPALPATTLANSCYQGMFYGCTSLTRALALPATTLAEYCYSGMFYGCTSLKLSSTHTGEYMQEYRIPTSGAGTTATNALTNIFARTGGTFTGTPSINTTYYLSSDNMIVRETEIATLNGYVGAMIESAGECIPVPTTASVGQVIAVKAVDADGKPTEWEARNMPTGWTVTDDGNGNVVIGG